MEYQILGITIDALLFNAAIRKYEAAGKDNIHIIKNKIQVLDLNIKGMDIDHFHDNVNFLTNSLSSHIMIIIYRMHQLFKEYNICKDSEFIEYLKDIEQKVLCEEVVFRNYMEADIIKDALSECNCYKLYEDIPYGYLSGTEFENLVLGSEVNDYKKRDNTGVRNINTNINTFNGKKKKDDIKDRIGEPDNEIVEGIPKWKLEPKVSKTGNTMVHTVNNYYWCTNNHVG